jgi:hypothetical protein
VTPQETVLLVRYVKACCPGSQIDEYTPDAWHDLLGDLELADCKDAAQAVAKRQPFVAAAEIRAEVKRIRETRLARTPLPAPPADAADRPGRYQQIIAANVKRIADGMDARKALGAGAPLPGDPPSEWQQARESLKPPDPATPDPREVALEQVKEARAKRERQESGEPAA